MPFEQSPLTGLWRFSVSCLNKSFLYFFFPQETSLLDHQNTDKLQSLYSKVNLASSVLLCKSNRIKGIQSHFQERRRFTSGDGWFFLGYFWMVKKNLWDDLQRWSTELTVLLLLFSAPQLTELACKITRKTNLSVVVVVSVYSSFMGSSWSCMCTICYNSKYMWSLFFRIPVIKIKAIYQKY